MKHLSLALILAFSLFSSATVLAKSLPNTQKIIQETDLFMSNLAKGDAETAINLISIYLGIDAEQFSQRAQKIISDMKRINASAGNPIAYAKLDEQSIGDHFFKARYLLKYQQAAIVWEINFYQPENGWRLVDISFNADINALFKE
ncbi:hypothetical protein A3758_13450 [Oleiphilus sp. HI0118]|jgi:thymidine kinase|nr:hypothetical protein A3758_13450 [Oleiphilus sp. HI0118]